MDSGHERPYVMAHHRPRYAMPPQCRAGDVAIACVLRPRSTLPNQSPGATSGTRRLKGLSCEIIPRTARCGVGSRCDGGRCDRRGSDTPPPSSPPRTLADLVNHHARCSTRPPCPFRDGQCRCGRRRFRVLSVAEPTHRTHYGGDVLPARHLAQYQELEDAYRNEPNFRTLTVAGRPAFVQDDRNLSGTQTCQLWVPLLKPVNAV